MCTRHESVQWISVKEPKLTGIFQNWFSILRIVLQGTRINFDQFWFLIRISWVQSLRYWVIDFNLERTSRFE